MVAAITHFKEIPVIDIGPLVERDASVKDRQRTADEIGTASRRMGLFYIKNHGIPESHREEMFAEMKRFFALPEAEKMRLHIGNSSQFRGYVPLCGEVTQEKKDWHECLDIQPKKHAGGDAADTGAVETGHAGRHPLDDPEQWPHGLPSFREVMMRTWDEKKYLSEKITEALALSLGLDAQFFKTYAGDELCDLRLLHYPPYEGTHDPGEVDAGMGAHYDHGFATVLSQDEAGGLDVLNEDGRWILAPHIPGTYLVNLGVMMQRWTNDRYRATLHRVQLPDARRQRYSIAFFNEPRYDALVEPLAVCCDADHPPGYAPCLFGEYLSGLFSKAYNKPLE
ncbi:MAG TPA: 2-oxoglutarate and iron-dependent oxygenase domain-containing protein [Pyrinomonadaceae bacterium]|jgi:isopenicillin N synthase-like dioxygenase